MDEAQLYEAVGRKQARVEHLEREYARVLAVLAEVCVGGIDPARVRIDLAAQSWAVLAEAPPAEPTQGDEVKS